MLKKNNIRHYRVPVSGSVSIKHNGANVPATLKDVSISGAFFFTETLFPAGTDIEVILTLPSDVGLPSDQVVCCQGRVVRVEQYADKYGMAAEFERVEPVQQA